MTQDDSKYTDPELREQIKEDITESDKGGQPGQCTSAASVSGLALLILVLFRVRSQGQLRHF